MESKTLLLALVGFGVAAYVAYQLGKGGAGESKPASGSEPSQNAPAQTSPPPSSGLDEGGGNLFPGLSGMDEATLCRLAPSVCAWRIPRPLPVAPML
jgi:hypothetical protein